MIDAVRFWAQGFFLPIFQCPCDHPFFSLSFNIPCMCHKNNAFTSSFFVVFLFPSHSLIALIHIGKKNASFVHWNRKLRLNRIFHVDFLLRWPVCTTITLIYKSHTQWFGWSNIPILGCRQQQQPKKKCCKCHLMLRTPFDKLIDLMVVSMTHRWKMNATDTPKVSVKLVLINVNWWQSMYNIQHNRANWLIHRCLFAYLVSHTMDDIHLFSLNNKSDDNSFAVVSFKK